MMKRKKRLKLGVLLFSLTFFVSTVFAATSGAIVFGGTVRINSVHTVQEVRLEFASASISCGFGRAHVDIVEDGGRQLLSFGTSIEYCPTFVWPAVMSHVDFEVRNTGNVPVEIYNFDYFLEGGQQMSISMGSSLSSTQFVDLWVPLLDNRPPVMRMTIEPGEVVRGILTFNPLATNVDISDGGEFVFNHRVALNYRQAR